MPFKLIELENEPMRDTRREQYIYASLCLYYSYARTQKGERERDRHPLVELFLTLSLLPRRVALSRFPVNSAAAKRSARSAGSNATTAYYTSLISLTCSVSL